MTASITIVNSSNWDGELVKVERHETGFTILQPGESVVMHSKYLKSVTCFDDPDKEREPMRNEDGKQVVPRVKVDFEIVE